MSAGEFAGGENFSGGENEGSHGQGSDSISRLYAEMQTLKQSHEQTSKSAQAANERMQAAVKALTGDGGSSESRQEWIDTILSVALENERNGGPGMPLTVEIATQLHQTQRQLQAALAKIEAQEAKQQRLSDPVISQENQAFSRMDTHLLNRVEEFYGEENPFIADAVSQLVADEIRDLKKHEPDTWKKVMRSEALQKKLVDHFVKEVVPPNARKLLHEVNEAVTPIGHSDLAEAWEEAQQIEDPRTRSEVMTLLRQKMLEVNFSGGRGRR